MNYIETGIKRDRVQIKISEEKRGVLPLERDIRILYVYEGKAVLRLDGTDVTLKRDDFYTVNSRELRAKVSDAHIFPRFWKRMVNAGSAHDLMRVDLQEHILILKNELGIEYVRFWDIYSPEMMIFDKHKEGHYNFTRIDTVVDFLLKKQMRPYFELGPKPNILLKSTSRYLISEKRERDADSPEKYGEFLEQMARHFVRKYGVDEVEASGTDFFQLGLGQPDGMDPKLRSMIKSAADEFYAWNVSGYENRKLSELDDIAKYIKHVHFKLYEMTDEGEEYSIDYKHILQYLHDHNYNGYVSTEYEGNRWVLPDLEIPELEQVTAHQKMIQRHIKEIEG